ncbi:RNA polymerase sigma factor [Actinomadura nitritigenes]|uniref:RNA polymerase sigma factor n=1 Tax=Actinomadura nitritigenes TaxID=134602 RepID=UPI003D8C2816
MPEDIADGRTVAVAAAGERWAVRRLEEESLPLVYNVVGRAVGGGPDVDDIVQETFARALPKLGQLRDAARLRPWLVSIALRQVKRALASQAAGPPGVRCRRRSPRSGATPGRISRS